MKRNTNISKIINGINTDDFIAGWRGLNGEGESLASYMELPLHTPPFSIKDYLENRTIEFCDSTGNIAKLNFIVNDDYFEFYGEYLGFRKTYRLYREWEENDSLEMVIHLESEAIGDCSRAVLLCQFDDKQLTFIKTKN